MCFVISSYLTYGKNCANENGEMTCGNEMSLKEIERDKDISSLSTESSSDAVITESNPSITLPTVIRL